MFAQSEEAQVSSQTDNITNQTSTDEINTEVSSFYRPQEGNVSRRVCLSFCPQGVGGWGWLPRMHHRSHDRREVYIQGSASGSWACIQAGLHLRVGVTSGRASLHLRGRLHPGGLHLGGLHLGGLHLGDLNLGGVCIWGWGLHLGVGYASGMASLHLGGRLHPGGLHLGALHPGGLHLGGDLNLGGLHLGGVRQTTTIPRYMGYNGIRSTSGRNSSYWNVFLLKFLFACHVN